jgi:hypothetical protein
MAIVCEAVADFGPCDFVRLVLVREHHTDSDAPSYAVKQRVCLSPGADGEPEHCYALSVAMMDFPRAASTYLQALAELEEQYDPWWQRRDVPEAPVERPEPAQGLGPDLWALRDGEAPLFAVTDASQRLKAVFSRLDCGPSDAPMWGFTTASPSGGSCWGLLGGLHRSPVSLLARP